MIFVFKEDDPIWKKIEANSEKEALLKILNTWLDKEIVTVEEICGSLDLELINVGELEDYE
jgi:hypothetical protein